MIAVSASYVKIIQIKGTTVHDLVYKMFDNSEKCQMMFQMDCTAQNLQIFNF